MDIKTSWVDLKVNDGTTMRAYTASPAEETSRSILVYQEAFGVNHYIRDMTERLASRGFTAIAPELYHRTAPGFECGYGDFAQVRPQMEAITTAGLEADVRAAYEWTTQLPGAASQEVACIGFCLGGRVSWITNSILPLKAAVSFYGAGIAPELITRAPDMHAPILMFWGGMDKHIPAEKTRSIAAALDNANKPHLHVEISYADHGFLCNERASYHAGAAAEAWALTLAFLDNKLKKS
jgi:carboxymethylenebutenolidase